MVVIKSTNDNVFGGFTSKPWNSKPDSHRINVGCQNHEHISDSSAFNFSLVNKDEKPFKTVDNYGQGIFCDETIGPSFGYGKLEMIYQFKVGSYKYYVNPFYDLKICSDSDMNQYSHSKFGNGFTNADYRKGTKEAKAILAGSYKFQNVEIEVFSHSD